MPFDATAPHFPPKFRERYRVLGVIGEGGMGVVFRAKQLALDREVAVKVLKSDGAEDEARFVREGQLLAALACPQIVRVLDADAEAGRLWLVCELVDGETLHDRQERDPLPLPQVLEVVLEVARALEVAHGRGIVHRDVKPENVIMLRDGGIKLADFGLARELATGQSLTSSGMVLGTPHFIAPEQVRGLRAGPASDQYALGVVLFWLATGSFPIDAAGPVDIMMRKCAAAAPLAHHANARVPRGVSALAERALAIEPGDRWPSITDFAQEIDRVRLAVAPPAGRQPGTTPMPRAAAAPARPPTSPLARRSLSIPPAPGRALLSLMALGLAGVLVAAVLLLVNTEQRRARDQLGPPPPVNAADIEFRNDGGEPVLEVRAPGALALRMSLERAGRQQELPALFPGADTRRFRVDPDALLEPAQLVVTSADGGRVTTSVAWPGMEALLEEQAGVLARARQLPISERFLRQSRAELLRELPALAATWARIGQRLFELAPALLDMERLPLERKVPVHDAMTRLSILDHLLRQQRLRGFLPEGALGRTFALGLADGAEVGTHREFYLDRKVRVTPAGQFGQQVVHQVLNLADPLEALDSFLLKPEHAPEHQRVVLELDTGSMTPLDLIWVRIGHFELAVTSDAHPRHPAYPLQATFAYVGLDPRMVGPLGTPVSFRQELIPGDGGHSEMRTIDRVGLYYLKR